MPETAQATTDGNLTSLTRSSWSERAQEWLHFKQESPTRRVADQSKELVQVLTITSRTLGLTERTVQKDKAVLDAAHVIHRSPTKTQIDTWQEAGWGTIGYQSDGQPINVQVNTETRPKVEQEIEARLKQPRAVLRTFLSKNHGNLLDVIERTLPNPQDQEAVVDLIITEVARLASTRQSMLPNTEILRLKAIEKIGQFLVDKSVRFSAIKGALGTESDFTPEQLKEIKTTADLADAVDMTGSLHRIFAAREWLVGVGREAFSGVVDPITGKRTNLKIYPTPYFDAIIHRADLLGRKENGIGGIIFYGPPGSGKSELAIEANRREGYETRVIQIHHYTSFNDLIGERSISISQDQATTYLTRLQMAREFFGRDAPQTMQALKDCYERSKANGKTTVRTFEEFMQYFVISDTETDYLSAASVQKGFIRYLDAQMAGAALGKETGNQFDDWVNGEVLIALEQKKRVVFDEIDKAGMFSLGGMLTLLAKSPGDQFTVGTRTVELPSWFKIHATANVLNLETTTEQQRVQYQSMRYLYDRFNMVKVDYPPLKDDLMIAAVKLSDREGNILLTEEEQVQLIGIYTFLLPELRAHYTNDESSLPLSFRALNELCSTLVDPLTRTRTNISLEKAVSMLLLENRDLGEAVQATTQKYYGLFQKPAETPQVKGPKTIPTVIPKWGEIVDASIARMTQAPLLKAIADFEVEEPPFDEEVTFHTFELSPKQITTLEESNEEQENPQSNTQIGLTVYPEDQTPSQEKHNKKYKINLGTVIGNRQVNLLESETREFGGPVTIEQVNAKGTHCLGTINEKQAKFSLWQDGPTSMEGTILNERFNGLTLTQDGKYVIGIKSDGQTVNIFGNEPNLPLNNYELHFTAKRIDVSPDGRYLLLEDTNGTTRIFDLRKLSRFKPTGIVIPDYMVKATDFRFVRPDLLVNDTTHGAILIEQKSDLDVWAK